MQIATSRPCFDTVRLMDSLKSPQLSAFSRDAAEESRWLILIASLRVRDIVGISTSFDVTMLGSSDVSGLSSVASVYESSLVKIFKSMFEIKSPDRFVQDDPSETASNLIALPRSGTSPASSGSTRSLYKAFASSNGQNRNGDEIMEHTCVSDDCDKLLTPQGVYRGEFGGEFRATCFPLENENWKVNRVKGISYFFLSSVEDLVSL